MVTAIIQARLSSTRLPGKVLEYFSDNTLLGHIIERLSYSKFISKIIVATTDSEADNKLIDWLINEKIDFFRGKEEDVLDRYFNAAINFNAENILRVTSDDPFKDPVIIDKVIEFFLNENLDFAYNNNPVSYPEGLDVEVFKFDALKIAHCNSQNSFQREHVTQYFYNNPELFKQKNLKNDTDYSSYRWTLDSYEDLLFTKEVYNRLYDKNKIFYFEDILKLLKKEPEIALINAGVKRSYLYNK
jgi:spore coat polysaccharide biosynthesis protein SpsF